MYKLNRVESEHRVFIRRMHIGRYGKDTRGKLEESRAAFSKCLRSAENIKSRSSCSASKSRRRISIGLQPRPPPVVTFEKSLETAYDTRRTRSSQECMAVAFWKDVKMAWEPVERGVPSMPTLFRRYASIAYRLHRIRTSDSHLPHVDTRLFDIEPIHTTIKGRCCPDKSTVSAMIDLPRDSIHRQFNTHAPGSPLRNEEVASADAWNGMNS